MRDPLKAVLTRLSLGEAAKLPSLFVCIPSMVVARLMDSSPWCTQFAAWKASQGSRSSRPRSIAASVVGVAALDGENSDPADGILHVR